MCDDPKRWCAYCMLPSMEPVAFLNGAIIWRCSVCGREDDDGE
jgi:hypothetical protein